MPKLIRAQKKGKVSSYTSRYKRNAMMLSRTLPLDLDSNPYKLIQFKKDNLSRLIAEFENSKKEKLYLTVPNGVSIGTELASESLPYKQVGTCEPGTEISNVELIPGGKRIAVTPGARATVLKHEKDSVAIQLPSKQKLHLDKNCRATIGPISGGDKKTKPWNKAGSKFYAMKSRGKKYPTVSANKMNVIDHPLGGSNRKARGRPMTVGRNRPPGAKYGSIAARRTGKK